MPLGDKPAAPICAPWLGISRELSVPGDSRMTGHESPQPEDDSVAGVRMLPVLREPSRWCCSLCKTGGCIRAACPGEDCPCESAGDPHGHAGPGDAAAIMAALIAAAPPVDGP